MKKSYFLTFVILIFAFNSNAQIIDDDFESYALGFLVPTAHWSNWSQSTGSSSENIIISNTFASSGTQSGFIGNSEIQDALLLLGNLTSGLYTLEFKMYVPSGNSGYFNIQGTIPGGILAGVFNSGDIYFNQDNANPGVGVDLANDTVTFNFPHDTWFTVTIDFNLDLGVPTYQIFIDGTPIDPTPYSFQDDATLGAIDFFSASATHSAYYDDFLFDNSLSVEEFSLDSFSVYPNPVNDILNINSRANVNSITIYNVLGKTILESTPNKISPSIDMSALPSGIYLVKVVIGENSKTIKVIK